MRQAGYMEREKMGRKLLRDYRMEAEKVRGDIYRRRTEKRK